MMLRPVVASSSRLADLSGEVRGGVLGVLVQRPGHVPASQKFESADVVVLFSRLALGATIVFSKMDAV